MQLHLFRGVSLNYELGLLPFLRCAVDVSTILFWNIAKFGKTREKCLFTQRKNMQYTELDVMSDMIIGVKVCNKSYIVKIIIMCVYAILQRGGSPDRLQC